MASKTELRETIAKKLQEIGAATYVIVDRDVDEFCRLLGIQGESRTQVTKVLNSLVHKGVLGFRRFYLDEFGDRCDKSGPHNMDLFGVERHYIFPAKR